MKNRVVAIAESLMGESDEQINFYEKNFKCKTYLDKASQMCILKTADVLKDIVNRTDRKTALITVSSSGCAVSSKKYLGQVFNLDKFKFASPLLFTHSLCNIPNSLTTIEFGMLGAANHYIGGADSTLLAMWQAEKYMEEFEQEYVVVTAYETVDRELDEYKINRKQQLFCEQGEGAGSILFVPENLANKQGKKILFAIERVCFVSEENLCKEVKDVDVLFTSSCKEFHCNAVQVVIIETELKSITPFVQINRLFQMKRNKEYGLEQGSRVGFLEKTNYGQYILLQAKLF